MIKILCYTSIPVNYQLPCVALEDKLVDSLATKRPVGGKGIEVPRLQDLFGEVFFGIFDGNFLRVGLTDSSSSLSMSVVVSPGMLMLSLRMEGQTQHGGDLFWLHHMLLLIK